MPPIELRTARRKKGLLEDRLTNKACTENAAQFRTSVPKFSAFATPSVATNQFGFELLSGISSNVGGIGILATAKIPWNIV
jgi:hypothetical protein